MKAKQIDIKVRSSDHCCLIEMDEIFVISDDHKGGVFHFRSRPKKPEAKHGNNAHESWR